MFLSKVIIIYLNKEMKKTRVQTNTNLTQEEVNKGIQTAQHSKRSEKSLGENCSA